MLNPSEAGRFDGLAKVPPSKNMEVVRDVLTPCTIGDAGNAWPLALALRTRRSKGVGNVRRGGQQCFPFTITID